MQQLIKLSILVLLMSLFSSHMVAVNAKGKALSTANKEATGVVQPTPEETKLTAEVQSALSAYAGRVEVTVTGTTAYLSGRLGADAEYEHVIMLAQSVKGIFDVKVDKLTIIDNDLPLYDLYLAAKVRGAFIQTDLMNQEVSSWPLRVYSKDSAVYLSGQVPTVQLQKTLVQVAQSVHGVTKVHDELEARNPIPSVASGQ